jgi:tetratricopeptide (TPR) repeat protein
MLASALGSPAAHGDWFETEPGRQRKSAATLMPTPIVMAKDATAGKTRIMKVRCYADNDYRIGVIRWQDRVRAQLEAMNRVVEPALGVRLEAESFKRWDRSADPGRLDDVLHELEQADVGAGVDWVFGFVTPMTIATNSIHAMGMARYLGRHLVVRGMSSVALMEQFNKDFDRLDPAEREDLYSAIKAHKEISVLLHEWAHTSGVLHSSEPSRVMNPSYSIHSSSFSQEDMTLLKTGLAARAAAGADGRCDWSQLKAVLEATTSPEWFVRERDELLRMLQPHNPAVSSVPAEPGRSREQADARAQIWELLKQDKEEEAWRILRPYLVQPSSEPALQALACRFKRLPELAAGLEDPCENALSSAKPDNPWPFAYAAQTTMARKERAQALLHLREAMRRGDKSGTLRADDWIWLAGLLRQLGAATWSEDALGRACTAGSADAMRTELARARRIWGLPKVEGDSLLSPEQESGYVDLWRATMDDLGAGRLKKAQGRLSDGKKQFAGTPGLLTLSCELAFLQKQLRTAENDCRAAVAVMDEQPRAHYLLAHIQLNQRKPEAALLPMKKAVALDPVERQPWMELSQIYRTLGRTKQATETLAEADRVAPAQARR